MLVHECAIHGFIVGKYWIIHLFAATVFFLVIMLEGCTDRRLWQVSNLRGFVQRFRQERLLQGIMTEPVGEFCLDKVQLYVLSCSSDVKFYKIRIRSETCNVFQPMNDLCSIVREVFWGRPRECHMTVCVIFGLKATDRTDSERFTACPLPAIWDIPPVYDLLAAYALP